MITGSHLLGSEIICVPWQCIDDVTAFWSERFNPREVLQNICKKKNMYVCMGVCMYVCVCVCVEELICKFTEKNQGIRNSWWFHVNVWRGA